MGGAGRGRGDEAGAGACWSGCGVVCGGVVVWVRVWLKHVKAGDCAVESVFVCHGQMRGVGQRRRAP